MRQTVRKVSIVMADDDEDDCFTIKQALGESQLDHTLKIIGSGRELMDYLRGHGKYKGCAPQHPDLILLDLYMPELNGREVLRELRTDPRLSDLDVVVLTDSTDWSELLECYELGATAVFTKAKWLETFAEIIRTSGPYWFKFVTFSLGSVVRRPDPDVRVGTHAEEASTI